LRPALHIDRAAPFKLEAVAQLVSPMFCGKPLNGSASERACSVGKNVKSWAIRGGCRPWLLFPFEALDAYAAEVGELVSDGCWQVRPASRPRSSN
jgi:hypothetical protein